MESEMMVLSDDGQTPRTTVNKRHSPKQPSRNKFNIAPVAFGCLAITFLAMLVAISVFALVSNNRKPATKTTKNEDNLEIALQAMFSTTFMLGNENRSLDIKNIEDITNQLNLKLSENRIRIADAYFRDDSQLQGYPEMLCNNPFSGNTLQLNFIAYYPRQCASQNEKTCKLNLQEELKNIFRRLSVISLTVQLGNNRFKTIDIQLCVLREMTEEEKTPTIELKKGKMETTAVAAVTPSKLAWLIPADTSTPYVALKKSQCNLNLGRFILVQIAGAFGSRIQDDTRVDRVTIDDPYRQYLTVTLYEDTTYRLHIQLSCQGQSDIDSYQRGCGLSQDVTVWIDYNGNGFDDGESRVLRRIRSNRKRVGNTFDFDLYIPVIDGGNTRSGSHRMRLSLTPTEQYQQDCGAVDNQETRDYTVNLVSKTTYPGVVETTPLDRVYANPLCSQTTGRISLVIMAGEGGTEIRDDKPTLDSLSNYQNRHHLAVTVYEHTIYLIRIQLDCSWQLNSDLFENGCNLAQDVSLQIDINNDGRFDESENKAPYRWPVASYMGQGIYDLQIYVPPIDRQYVRDRQHRMRVVILNNENYQRLCGRADYNETREYSINIVPRGSQLAVADRSAPYMTLNNIVCSAHLGKIVLVILAGEHRTQIRDDPSLGFVQTSDSRNHQSQTVVLYEDTVYQLRIQLDCSRLWSSDTFEHSCSLAYDVNVWIDLNGDGNLDSSESVAPYQWPLNSYTPQGIYDLQLFIPVIDGNRTRTGAHRMQLVVSMSEQYRRKCGNNGHKETREYTVSIVPITRRAEDAGLPFLVLNDAVCSQKNGKVALVIMTGEQGTHIRDNIPTNNVLRENQNRHHLAVTLFENTVYRLRIQLDCFPHARGGFPASDCNVAQDVNVLIDFNNDGRFDETESRVPQRWPLLSPVDLGIYDLQISIPAIDQRNRNLGPHRMRIVVMPSEEYRRKCGSTDARETREYTVNVIPKTTYRELEYQYVTEPRGYAWPDTRATYCPAGNLACSEGNSAITAVSLYGAQGTQIRDEMKQCNSVNNYHDRTNLVASLFDNTAYTLRVEVNCVLPLGYENSYGQQGSLYGANCNHAQYLGVWVDLNNDGVFDETTERIVPSNRYEDGQRTNQYDLNIAIPKVGGRNYLSEQHRMRIVLSQDDRSRKPCYSTGYGEARDYTVQILSNPEY